MVRVVAHATPGVTVPVWGAAILVALTLLCVGVVGYQAYWHLTDPVGFEAHYRVVVVNGHVYRASDCRWINGVCEPRN